MIAAFLCLSLSGLSQAAEEAVETAIHVADTGHAAHAAHQPEDEHEGDDDACPEHLCSGPFHHCGCCPSTSATAPSSALTLHRTTNRLDGDIVDDDLLLDGIRSRIDRPPRA